jgi:hypothetical protein
MFEKVPVPELVEGEMFMLFEMFLSLLIRAICGREE